jgi:hypothetical protein
MIRGIDVTDVGISVDDKGTPLRILNTKDFKSIEDAFANDKDAPAAEKALLKMVRVVPGEPKDGNVGAISRNNLNNAGTVLEVLGHDILPNRLERLLAMIELNKIEGAYVEKPVVKNTPDYRRFLIPTVADMLVSMWAPPEAYDNKRKFGRGGGWNIKPDANGKFPDWYSEGISKKEAQAMQAAIQQANTLDPSASDAALKTDAYDRLEHGPFYDPEKASANAEPTFDPNGFAKRLWIANTRESPLFSELLNEPEQRAIDHLNEHVLRVGMREDDDSVNPTGSLQEQIAVLPADRLGCTEVTPRVRVRVSPNPRLSFRRIFCVVGRH